MRKLLIMALKEVRLAFRDVGALVTMLVTPLALTLAFGAAFGASGSAVLTDIPVLVLDQDQGAMADQLVDILQSDSVGELLAVEMVQDDAAARARVDADAVAALVTIPSGFTDRSFPLLSRVQEQVDVDLLSLDPEQAESQLTPEQQRDIAILYTQLENDPQEDPITIEIFASADRPISVGVVKGLVSQVLEQLHMTTQGISNILAALTTITTQQQGGMQNMARLMTTAGEEAMTDVGVDDLPVKLRVVSPSGRPFSWLNYSATSMAVLFLMFAVTSGGRTLLAERQGGTLPRLLVSPTPALTILIGKMGGIVLTGMLQVLVLWGATTLIGAYWGDPFGVLLAIVSLVLSATGVGALISAWSQTPGQAGAIGTMITLIGSGISGSFFPRSGLPSWLQSLSLLMPNAWGIEIFSRLQLGKSVSDILPWLGGLLLLTIAYYTAAAFGFRRQFD
ncbi:MAG: ABC transporter permease [Anaerolineae bacterium]|nr:ABC transporter permease [Anaerolineae bacterium]